MSLRAVARQHGNRGAGRTRFPSVNALSEFSHNQGQGRSWHRCVWLVSCTSDPCPSCCSAEIYRCVPRTVLSMCDNVCVPMLTLFDHPIGTLVAFRNHARELFMNSRATVPPFDI